MVLVESWVAFAGSWAIAYKSILARVHVVSRTTRKPNTQDLNITDILVSCLVAARKQQRDY